MSELDHAQLSSAIQSRLHEMADASAVASLLIQSALEVVPYTQAACLVTRVSWGSCVIAASHVSDIEQTSPYSIWIKRLFRKLVKTGHEGRVPIEMLRGRFDPSKFAPGHIVFLPLNLRGGQRGGFFFMRPTEWSDAEIESLSLLMPAAQTRIGYLQRMDISLTNRKVTLRGVLLTLLAAAVFLFPIRLSSVAPVEVVPIEPSVVSSAIPGVVKSFHVISNDPVKVGQVLVTLDDLDQKSKLSIARRDLNVTEAELRRLQQMGFQDPTQRFRLAELEGQLRIRQLEVQRAEAELERTIIRAERDGIAICGDPLDWQGRPVQIGERIMLIGEAERTALRIMVPVTDGPVLSPQTVGRVYLDSDPWRARSISVANWVFEPEVTPAGLMAFRAQAKWSEATTDVRIGMRGTAHLDGKRAPFIAYLLRRPIILFRQSISL